MLRNNDVNCTKSPLSTAVCDVCGKSELQLIQHRLCEKGNYL